MVPIKNHSYLTKIIRLATATNSYWYVKQINELFAELGVSYGYNNPDLVDKKVTDFKDFYLKQMNYIKLCQGENNER